MYIGKYVVFYFEFSKTRQHNFEKINMLLSGAMKVDLAPSWIKLYIIRNNLHAQHWAPGE